MDNNFNQSGNQNYNTNYNQPYAQPQYNASNGNGMGAYQATETSTVLTAPQKPNILLGTLGALIAAVVGALLWVVIAAFTGYVIFILAVGIAFLALFLYDKFAKGIDLVGTIICVVFTCVAIYFGNRYGYICSVASELDCSISEATTWFELACDIDSSYNLDYIKNMVLSYVVGVGYTAVM